MNQIYIGLPVNEPGLAGILIHKSRLVEQMSRNA